MDLHICRAVVSNPGYLDSRFFIVWIVADRDQRVLDRLFAGSHRCKIPGYSPGCRQYRSDRLLSDAGSLAAGHAQPKARALGGLESVCHFPDNCS